MELEALKNDLLTVINHYGKTIPIGAMFYVVKDVLRDIGDAYNQWIDSKNATAETKTEAESAEEPAPAQAE